VALLRLLEALRHGLGITLVVIHFDHTLRGAESDGDAQFVADLARERGYEWILGREDVAAAAASHKWNLEDAARRLRYAFFEHTVAEGNATRIAVAHTADDQAETVLAHILRGTGLPGLAGIYPVAGSVSRPLLRQRRGDLRKYLRALGQTWREDSSNRDLHRMRARIRERLLPMIESDFSPRVVDQLGSLARLAHEEEIFWSALAEDRFRALVKAGGGKFSIRVGDLLAPLELTSLARPASATVGIGAPLRTLTERLIRRILQEVRGDRRGFTSMHIDQVIRLAAKSTSGRRIGLPGAIVVERNFDRLIFSYGTHHGHLSRSKETCAPPHAYQYVVSLPGSGAVTVSVPELQSRFQLKVIDWPIAESDTKRGGIALDADLLRNPLILRNWRSGDSYRPLGRHRLRKLKDMFISKRVPSRERSGWPVLECEGRVVWARGMPPADEFCAGKDTRTGLVIEEDRS